MISHVTTSRTVTGITHCNCQASVDRITAAMSPYRIAEFDRGVETTANDWATTSGVGGAPLERYRLDSRLVRVSYD